MVNSNARGRREKIKKKVVDDTLSHKRRHVHPTWKEMPWCFQYHNKSYYLDVKRYHTHHQKTINASHLLAHANQLWFLNYILYLLKYLIVFLVNLIITKKLGWKYKKAHGCQLNKLIPINLVILLYF
jgi:hypothetical protein